MGANISYANPSGIIEYFRGRKRRRHSDAESQAGIDKIIEIAMHTPKRKKLGCTVQYIYQTLFVEGRDSDVTVVALGEHFLLHKVYLCQSPYFASMFGGNWRESGESMIEIDVVDPLITKNALRTVLGALYNDEVHLDPLGIVSVLATATMLQLTCVIEKSVEVMLETINPQTAIKYYRASRQYGDIKLQESCIQWFLVNLMLYCNNNLRDLEKIPMSLMQHLVGHADLCVIKTEISLYVLLTQWMYLKLFPNHDDVTSKVISEYYGNREGNLPFLLTENGSKFKTVFCSLRIQHLISHNMDVELVYRDNIIPHEWLDRTIVLGWKCTLKINQSDEEGPHKCSNEIFLQTSMRCGRELSHKGKRMWRWTGFHYGLDIVMILDERSLLVKRNHRPEYEQLLSLQTVRHVAIRVSVFSLNEQKQILSKQSTGIQRLGMNRGEEFKLLTFTKDIQFPILLSANILFTSPFQYIDYPN